MCHADFLGDAEIAADFVAGNTVLAVHEQPHCSEPLVQTERRILKDSSDLDGELRLGVLAPCTRQMPPRGDEAHISCAAARRANRYTVGPAPGH